MSDTVTDEIIDVISKFTEEWGIDHEITPASRVVADLEFESIDIIQMIVSIEQRFGRRNMGFDELLMKDGKYVDDLTIQQISVFVKKQLVAA